MAIYWLKWYWLPSRFWIRQSLWLSRFVFWLPPPWLRTVGRFFWICRGYCGFCCLSFSSMGVDPWPSRSRNNQCCRGHPAGRGRYLDGCTLNRSAGCRRTCLTHQSARLLYVPQFLSLCSFLTGQNLVGLSVWNLCHGTAAGCSAWGLCARSLYHGLARW